MQAGEPGEVLSGGSVIYGLVKSESAAASGGSLVRGSASGSGGSLVSGASARAPSALHTSGVPR